MQNHTLTLRVQTVWHQVKSKVRLLWDVAKSQKSTCCIFNRKKGKAEQIEADPLHDKAELRLEFISKTWSSMQSLRRFRIKKCEWWRAVRVTAEV